MPSGLKIVCNHYIDTETSKRVIMDNVVFIRLIGIGATAVMDL